MFYDRNKKFKISKRTAYHIICIFYKLLKKEFWSKTFNEEEDKVYHYNKIKEKYLDAANVTNEDFDIYETFFKKLCRIYDIKLLSENFDRNYDDFTLELEKESQIINEMKNSLYDFENWENDEEEDFKSGYVEVGNSIVSFKKDKEGKLLISKNF